MSGAEPPSQPAPARSTRVVAVVVVLVLVVALVAYTAVNVFGNNNGTHPDVAPPEPSSTVAAPSYVPSLKHFYDQSLDWHTCDTNECAQLTVPLDYADPGGKTIKLAVLRSLATHRSERVGQLVVNPGGPGGSGVDYAAGGSFTFGAELARYFDIVGFDPRGVGKSTPLDCGDTKQTDAFVDFDPDPDTPAEVAGLDQVTHDFGEDCLEHSGDLARHMSTVEVAKDMDVLRAALGEHQLDYLGASYGTLIGATYAKLFPTHIRRMVLDGALDPKLTGEQVALGQARGFQTALDAYLANCVQSGKCPLGDSVDAGAQRIRALLEQLDTHPLPTSSAGRDLTEGLARYGVILPLYLKQLWPTLTLALNQAINQGRGDALLALSDQYTARGAHGYTDNSMAALNAVSCLDYRDSVPVDQIPSKFAEFDQASPTFGRLFVYGLSTCASWPVKSTAVPAPIHAAGAPPIVVVGTTRDPATPYAWARSLASQLDSGHLISRNGDGHTGFHMGNKCVDDAVDDYLVGGVVPKDNLSC
jgi:pimeloyl-ACP methyl ester carboxylesterase